MVQEREAEPQGQPQAEESPAPEEHPAYAAEPSAADANPSESPHEELQRALEASQEQVQQQHEALLRARAELENLQRRQQRELENAHKYALDNFVRELLQVWDSLELGLAAAADEGADLAKIREGMELTLKIFNNTMEKFQVLRLDPEGEPFNPEFHQAMSMVSHPELPTNSVVTVVQKGCTLNGRLVRPALVMVSQGSGS